MDHTAEAIAAEEVEDRDAKARELGILPEDETANTGHILEGEARLTIGTVAAGGHA